MRSTSQLIIVHLSDIHFGSKHRFLPAKSPSGDIPVEKEYPTLIEKLQEDLNGKDPGCPVIICITGDMAETGSLEEFQQAELFIRELAKSKILQQSPGLNNIFTVPGNHDVRFDSDDTGARWQQWIEFHNRLRSTSIHREDPLELVELHNRIDDLGALILTINSSIYVQRAKPDEIRGRIDIKQLTKIEAALEAVSAGRLKASIRIALIHHHPVLIPPLAEPNRGYDAVHNSGKLLTILRKYGFHILLHGHKHDPYIFTDDVKPAFQDIPDQPLVIVAGGSASSISIPNSPRSCNCYNLIQIKWHPGAYQTRISIDTRGLDQFNKDGSEKLPTRWKWKSLKQYDRTFLGGEKAPRPQTLLHQRRFDPAIDSDFDLARIQVYENTRGNLPVAEVMPSLVPEQAYEARLWIAHHDHGQPDKQDFPSEVTWSAGSKFPVITVKHDEDRLFCTVFNYWGPMLVQARLLFKDGHSAVAHVYVRIPTDHDLGN